jgi:hypothetical protein
MKPRWLIVLMTPIPAILGCSEVVPGSCYLNPTGGAGGADSMAVGAGVGASSGDFISPPRGPLDYGGAPDPCIMPQSPCNEKCLADYEAAAGECGKIENEAQRKTCQDGAYAHYKGCNNNCQQQSDDKEKCKQACDRAYDKCMDKCKDSDCRNACWNDYVPCLRDCDR